MFPFPLVHGFMELSLMLPWTLSLSFALPVDASSVGGHLGIANEWTGSLWDSGIL